MGGRTTSSLTSSGATEFRAPLSIPGGEVAGAELVRELPQEVALPAWQTLRSVLAWAAAEPGARGPLFDPDAMEAWEIELLRAEWDPDLRLPLAVIVGLLVDPEAASPERMARACLCVADWALERGAVSTALAFAEAAALSWPEQPRYAYMCGRLLRAHARGRAAEQWMRRCVRGARDIGDPEIQTLGLNSLGNILYERGDFPAAKRILSAALRLARRHHLHERQGEVLHDLCVVATWSEELIQAEQYARESYDIYRTGHERLPRLAHDIAVLWMKQGYFSRALFVLRELPQFLDSSEDRARVQAILARAAAACGQANVFEDAWNAAYPVLSDPSFGKRAAPDFYELGIAASSLGQWERAIDALDRALALAQCSGESDVVHRAEVALANVRAGRVAESSRHVIDSRNAPATDVLAVGMLTSLHERVEHYTAV